MNILHIHEYKQTYQWQIPLQRTHTYQFPGADPPAWHGGEPTLGVTLSKVNTNVTPLVEAAFGVIFMLAGPATPGASKVSSKSVWSSLELTISTAPILFTILKSICEAKLTTGKFAIDMKILCEPNIGAVFGSGPWSTKAESSKKVISNGRTAVMPSFSKIKATVV